MEEGIEAILTHIERLSSMDRIMCSAGFDAALEYVAGALRCPEEDVSVDLFPRGSEFWGWSVPASLKFSNDFYGTATIPIPPDRPLKVLHVTIPGRTDREILFLAHLDHPQPSANDNASGAAMMIELINHFAQHQPYFSLRFLFTVEYFGTVAFCSRHEDLLPRIVAGIALDMVGADQNLGGGAMIVDEVPDYSAGTIDLVLRHCLAERARSGGYRQIGSPVAAFRCDFQYFTWGSDHYILNDIDVAIPSTCLNTYPDPFYHTKDDTADKISKETLRLFFRAIIDAIGWFGDMSDGAVDSIALLVLARLEESADRALLGLARGDGAVAAEAAFRVEAIFRHCLARLTNLAVTHHTARAAQWQPIAGGYYEGVQERLRRIAGPDVPRAATPPAACFKRLFRGPLYRNGLLARLSGDETTMVEGMIAKDPLLWFKLDLALNYCRSFSAGEIAMLWCLHYGGDCDLRLLEDLFALLARHGLVEAV